MIDYNELSEELRAELQAVADTDKFGTLSPETIYQGIVKSTGTDKKLAEFYEVEVSLVSKIKELNN